MKSNKIIKYIKNPALIIVYLNYKGYLKWMPDRLFIKIAYKGIFEKKIDLNNPHSFNEKLNWLKLYDRNPLYTKLVDKHDVKEYVSKKIGKEYINPTLGIWNSVDEIEIEKMPNSFVLKATHDSGGLVIVKSKNNLNWKEAKEILAQSLKRDFYYQKREWPYKNVVRRIIAEPYLEDNKTKELRDYKLFCFNGKVEFFKIDFDRYKNHRANYYDINKNILPFGELKYLPDLNKKIEIPNTINVMIELAEKLAKGIPFVRVDFYDVNGKIIFGEMTFYPTGGFGKYTPSEYDDLIGEKLLLPKKEV